MRQNCDAAVITRVKRKVDGVQGCETIGSVRMRGLHQLVCPSANLEKCQQDSSSVLLTEFAEISDERDH